MRREFVETREFTKNWQVLGFTDKDLARLQAELLENPKLGPVIQGTGSLRKMRFSYPNRSKRDSVRVCYVDFPSYNLTFLITVYAKNEKDTLSKQECNEIKKFIALIENELNRGA